MHTHHHTGAAAGPLASSIVVSTTLQPGQLALFEPAQPTLTYLEVIIDHGLLRTCSGCRRALPFAMFPASRIGRTDAGFLQCRDCRRTFVRIRRGVARPDAHRRPSADQRCEVCGSPGGKKGIYLDHDHETGAFRGWLCGGCNTALGNAHDDPDILRALAAYIEAHNRQAVA